MSFHSGSRIQKRTNTEPPVCSGILHRKNGHQGSYVDEHAIVPSIVNDALRSPGQSLSSSMCAYMQSRFNYDFSKVKLHTDAPATQSAREVNARAYTVQNDVVFGQGQYQPTSESGIRLMAHELAHVVQQNNSGNSASAEARAEKASENVANNQVVLPEVVGGASPGLYADNGEEERTSEETPTPALETQPAFSLGWTDMARIGTFQLTPLSLLMPPPRRLSLGSPPLSSLTSPTLSVPALPPPSLLPPTTSPVTAPSSTPSTGTGEETSEPSMPSRLPVVTRGRFSLGLRLGFPELERPSIPGMPESPLAESLRRATIMNQMLTGNVPSGWEAVDKTQLARAIWGIFSTNIAPDLANSITSGLSTPAGPAGISYELDLMLLTDFSSEIGGGLSFTVRYPSLESLFTGR